MFTHLRLALLIASSIIVMTASVAAQVTSGSIDASPAAGFEENKGQISDQFGQARPDVQFSFVQKGFRMRLLRNGVAYELTQHSSLVDEGVHRPFGDGGTPSPDGRRDAAPPLVTVHRVDVGFAGAAAMPRIETGEVLDGYANYYYAHLPEQGATFVRSYASVTYRDLYEGVDMVVHTRASLDGSTWPVSTDFVVRAGADPAQIRIRYEGARDVRVTATGELEITTDLGTIREQAPVCRAQLPTGAYVNVGGRFRLDEGEVSFAIDAYPTDAVLTIDPGLVWATYYGGTGDDVFNDVGSDQSGAIYAAGTTGSTASIATTGAHKTTFGGSLDAMLVKLRANGTRLWATYAGGPTHDDAVSIAVTPSGHTYIAGTTNSVSGISTSGAYQTSLSGSYDAFIMHFDSAGVRASGTYYGGMETEWLYDIALAGTTHIVIVGSTRSVAGIASAGAHQTGNGGSTDAFIARLTADGSARSWGSFYGGTDTDVATTVTVDNAGSIIAGGFTSSTGGIASTGAHDVTFSGSGPDGFLVKFSSSGSRSWGTYYGGNGADYVHATAVTSTNAILFAGSSTSTDAVASSGAHDSVNQSNAGMLVSFSSTGTRYWGTYIGDWPSTTVLGICVSDSSYYICGRTTDATWPMGSSAYQDTIAGGLDGFVITYGLGSDIPRLKTYFGGSQTDVLYALAVVRGGSTAGDIIVCGSTSSDGISSGAVMQTTRGGGSDGLVVTMRPVGITFPLSMPNALCTGASYPITFTTTGTFASTNIFRAQLSNSHGSFASGTSTIGVRMSPSGGTMNTTIPANAVSGTQYLVRLYSSNPITFTSLAQFPPSWYTKTIHSSDTSYHTWNGSFSPEWSVGLNWFNPCATPGPGDTVRIPQTTRAPVTAAAVTIGALELGNSGGLTLGGDLTIGNKLTLTRGALTLGTHNLVLGSGATVSGGGDSALVVTNGTGRMRSSGRVIARQQLVDFPIGPALGSYNPVHIVNDGTGDEFFARVLSGVTTTGGSGGTPITTDVVGRTWQLAEAVPGGSLLAVEFGWKNTHELPSFDRRDCFVAQHDGRAWVPVSAVDRATGTNPYARVATGLTMLGPFAIGDQQSVIPVELVLFTARTDGADVVLAWETADERANAGFEVQRARVGDDAWTVVAFVAARAAEGSGAKYETVDRSVAAGTWRYRLRQVDVDGRAEYSQAVTVVVGDAGAVPLVAVHPNPARDIASVTVRDARVVVVRDVLGREVWRAEVASGGVQTLVMPTQFIPAGVYVVETELARTLLRIVR